MEISAAKFSKANVYFCGGLLNTTAGLALGLVVNPSFGWLVPMAILLGVGTSTTIIQTYAIAAEVFGQDEQTSGFCFGIMGIFEKTVNGGVIIGIQERVQIKVAPCSMVLDLSPNSHRVCHSAHMAQNWKVRTTFLELKLPNQTYRSDFGIEIKLIISRCVQNNFRLF